MNCICFFNQEASRCFDARRCSLFLFFYSALLFSFPAYALALPGSSAIDLKPTTVSVSAWVYSLYAYQRQVSAAWQARFTPYSASLLCSKCTGDLTAVEVVRVMWDCRL